MKCPNCGIESEDGRYYCGKCGSAVKETSIPEGTHILSDSLVWDIDRTGLTLALMGLLVVIFGVFLYMYGTTYKAWFEYSPAIPWWVPTTLIGSLMMVIGIVMNAAQRLPKSAQGALVCETFSVAAAAVLSVVLALTVTRTFTYWTEGGLLVEIQEYGHRSSAILYFATIGMLPIIAGYVLWTRNRIAWIVALAVAFVEMPISWIWFFQFFDAYTASIVALIQIPLIVLLLLPSARRWYWKSDAWQPAL